MTKPNYIVGIGASAGGLEALEVFFANISPHSGVAYLVIQHLSPDFKSMMAEILRRYTTLPIHEMENGMRIETDSIYLNIPRHDVRLRHGRLILTPSPPASTAVRPINLFFESLAEDYGQHAIGVILSGSGQDGAKGMGAIHAARGLTLVQGLETALFSGMPQSATREVPNALILSPSEMPAAITEYILDPETYPILSNETSLLTTDENALTYLISLLRRRFEIDFTRYKHHTLFRRLDARLQMAKAENLSGYIRFLQDNTEEQNALYRDLLIDVTAFFRDREAFTIIQKEVVPLLVKLKEAGEMIRIWVAACATGEEAYSLAILFLEEINKQGKELDLKIFATDAHQDSIAKASAGIYSYNRLQAVEGDLFEKYFYRADSEQNEYQIIKEVRAKVVFATHNLLENPHFSQLDMISCRNLLIYFDDEAQEELLSRFHIGLKMGGCLFLGSSEHLRQTASDYHVVSAQWRIYKKTGNQTRPEIKDRSDLVNRLPQHLQKQAQLSGYRNWETRLLQRLVQIGYVVDGQGNLKEVYGEGRKLLQFKAGRAALTLTNLLPDNLAIPVRTGLQTAQQEDREVRFDAVDLGEEGSEIIEADFVSINIVPFQGSSIELGNSGKYYLISIDPLALSGGGSADPSMTEVKRTLPSSRDISKIQSLEQELTFTRESLQATIEEMQSANEELQSANEELQSTNEELSSVNEELFTVNAEYQEQNQLITRLNSDMQNMLNASQVLLIFLDKELFLREVSPAARRLFGFLDSDIGRPIDHFSLFKHTQPAQLRNWINRCFNGETFQTSVQTRNTVSLVLQISPYINQAGDISGIILYFIDFLDPFHAKMFSTLLPNSSLIQALSPHLDRLIFLFDFLQNQTVFHFGNLLGALGHQAAAPLELSTYLSQENWREGINIIDMTEALERPIDLLDAAGNEIPGTLTVVPYREAVGGTNYQGLVIISLSPAT